MQSTKNTHRKRQQHSKNLRWITLLIILGLSTLMGILHQAIRTVRTINVDQLCPFGALESLFSVITRGEMLHRIAVSSFILMLFVVIVTLLFRRAFCGLFCPLGTLQEIFDRLGKKIFKKHFVPGDSLDRPFRWFKYLILFLIVGFSWYYGQLVIRPFDPWVAYHHIVSNKLSQEFFIGFLVLVITLFFSVFYRRIFCKYLCPLGAFVAFLAPLGISAIERNKATCTHCKLCDKVCPVNLEVSTMKKVTHLECIQCQECVNVCPEPKTLEMKVSGMKRVYPNQVLAVVIGVFVVLVGLTSLSGDFQWVRGGGNYHSYENGVGESALDDTIRRRSSFAEIAQTYEIPKERIMEHFEISEEEYYLPLRDFIDTKPYTMNEIRIFAQSYVQNNHIP